MDERREGSPAAAPSGMSMDGERRTVTVLFADISGFTALSEKLDPESVRSLVNRCFDRLVPIVARYGGAVDKFMCDEIMAIFGAPHAHENDPERAVRAALEIWKKAVDYCTLTESTFHDLAGFWDIRQWAWAEGQLSLVEMHSGRLRQALSRSEEMHRVGAERLIAITIAPTCSPREERYGGGEGWGPGEG